MRVHAIQTGTVQVTRRQTAGRGGPRTRVFWTLADRSFTEPLPVLAWLIEHPDGPIVVDTGETARATRPGWFPRWHPYFRLAVRFDVQPEDEIGPQLRARGFEPDEIHAVVLTHMHCDHADGVAAFPRSRILVSGVEHRSARGRAGQLRGYTSNQWPHWFDPELIDFRGSEPYGSFDSSIELAAGVRLVATPGHTRGHLSVVVEDDERTLVLAGDISYSEQLLYERVVDGVTDDPRTARDTVDRMLAFVEERDAVFLPTHDPDAPARLAASG